MKKSAAFIIMLFVCLSTLSTDTVSAAHDVHVYLFWGDGCPHCAREKAFLEQLEGNYPELRIHYHEVYYNRSNYELFSKMAAALGEHALGVPATFIDDGIVFGYGDDSTTGRVIEEKLKACIENGCRDPITLISSQPIQKNETETVIAIPVIGSVDVSKASLPVLTVILGAVDGFNPCAFFVLFFLLSMLVYAKSRRRMLLIGGTFVFFSGLVYFLFMTAWLNLFMIVGGMQLISMIVGAVALVFALINIKDFFFFKKGVSLSIPDGAKPRLFEGMRAMLRQSSVASMMFGTVVLAVTANTYELLCTAGFPMIFTRILTLSGLTKVQYYSYLILYNAVYITPLLFIVLVFTFTLGAHKLSAFQGQVLKLISGLMLLSMSLVLLMRLPLLNTVFLSLATIIAIILLTIVIIIVRKTIGKGGNKDENRQL